ncbi:hypothetical protein F4810DRAFT_715516 [Camillea tinctor]|nr:hypothetical protein F4810DRAFT_715516 [Camillea tinctor]
MAASDAAQSHSLGPNNNNRKSSLRTSWRAPMVAIALCLALAPVRVTVDAHDRAVVLFPAAIRSSTSTYFDGLVGVVVDVGGGSRGGSGEGWRGVRGGGR